MEKDTIDILNGLIDWDELKRTAEEYKQKAEEEKTMSMEMPKIVLEKGEYSIWLISLGERGGEDKFRRKLDVMGKLQEFFDKGIATNKRLVDNLPSKIEENLSYATCLEVQEKFKGIGCETKITRKNETLYEGKFKLELLYAGSDRIETLKKIKDHFKIDNASALRMLNNLPISLVENVSFEQCLEIQKVFDANKCTMQVTKIN